MIDNGTISLDVSVLQWLVYVGIPFVVDLVTRRFSDGRVKALAVAVLAIITALVQEILEAGGSISFADLAGKFVTAVVTAYVMHNYVWEPARLTGDRGVIQKNLPDGIGNPDQRKVAALGGRKG